MIQIVVKLHQPDERLTRIRSCPHDNEARRLSTKQSVSEV